MTLGKSLLSGPHFPVWKAGTRPARNCKALTEGTHSTNGVAVSGPRACRQ